MVVLPGAVTAVQAGDGDALDGATIDVGNIGGDDGGDEIAAVAGGILGDGRQAGGGGREHGRIVDGGDGQGGRLGGGAIGGGAAVGTHVDAGVAIAAGGGIPGPEGDVAGGAGVGGVGHEANGGSAVQEHGVGVGDGAKGGPARAGVVLPLPVGIVHADDGEAFDGAGIDIGDAIAPGTRDDGGHGIARGIGVILDDVGQASWCRCYRARGHH